MDGELESDLLRTRACVCLERAKGRSRSHWVDSYEELLGKDIALKDEENGGVLRIRTERGRKGTSNSFLAACRGLNTPVQTDSPLAWRMLSGDGVQEVAHSLPT